MRRLILLAGIVALGGMAGPGARAAVYAGPVPTLERPTQVLTVDDPHRRRHEEARRRDDHRRDRDRHAVHVY